MTKNLIKALSTATADQDIKSLNNAFEIMTEIKQRDSARLTELVEATGLSSSSVHKHLQTLLRADFVTKEDDEYRVGLRFLELGAHAREQITGSKEIEMKARKLADRTEETVEFTTHEHGRAVVLFRETGRHGVMTEGKVGKRFYIHQCAAGKALLSELPDETIHGIVEHNGLPALTEKTITDVDQLFDEISTIRERGFAINCGESTTGLRAVAVPLKAPDERPIGAFAVAGPKHRMGDEHLTEELPALIKSVVTELELNLAHS